MGLLTFPWCQAWVGLYQPPALPVDKPPLLVPEPAADQQEFDGGVHEVDPADPALCRVCQVDGSERAGLPIPSNFA